MFQAVLANKLTYSLSNGKCMHWHTPYTMHCEHSRKPPW